MEFGQAFSQTSSLNESVAGASQAESLTYNA